MISIHQGESKSSPFQMGSCAECGGLIPTKRLQAVPGATHCVPCLKRQGDVPRLQRLDQTVGTLEDYVTHEYLYSTPNQYMVSKRPVYVGQGYEEWN